jgi:aminoglycoside phosphotransferase (APT) family kinase protein
VATSRRRDLEATRTRVRGCLATHLGVPDVEVSELAVPRAGYSNETMYFRASWHESGRRRTEDLVLRIEPTDHQLFVRPDAMSQARMMTALARHPGVPAPRIWFTEPDPAILGSPFFVMQKTPGRIPGDVPSWHATGWTRDLPPADRARLYDNGLAALVALHRIDWRDGFGFLADPGDPGDAGALDRYLADLVQWYEWCGPSRRYGAETLDEAMAHLLDRRPADPTEGVVWGDARVGNIIFSDDLAVAAVLDWESTTLGPPGIDLGWWLMFEEFLCEAQGLDRLEGVPGRQETIDRYRALGGPPVADVEYYELLACTVLTLINSRLADLLIASGRLPEHVASEYPLRVVGMARRRLDALLL